MARKVSLRAIIGNVVGDLGIENVNNVIDDFARWAFEAEMKIGSTNSYKRFECEIQVKNQRAPFPSNLAYLNGIKLGDKWMAISKRQFRMFNKGTQTGVTEKPDERRQIGGQQVINKPGVVQVDRFDFSGTFMAGEVINITIVSNNLGKLSTNLFTYIVQVADTPQDVANAFDSQISAIPNLPFFSQIGGDSFTVEGRTPNIVLTYSIGNDSAFGSVSFVNIQKRIAPRENFDPKNSNAVTPKFRSENLANNVVYKFNNGLTAQSRGGGSGGLGNYGFNLDFVPLEQVFSIANDCIYFNSSDANDFRVGISYMGWDIDEEGWPVVYWQHEDAVTQYLKFMYLSKRYYQGKLPKHVYDSASERWYWLCGQARGDDELPDQEEIRYLSNLWVQLIPSQNKNFF